MTGIYAPLDAARLKVIKTQHPSSVPNFEELEFGKKMTDHMLQVRWSSAKGWHTPIIKPYEKICLDPTASVLHYGFECFEGMKAYKGADGRVRLFRPRSNLARLNSSAGSIMLPCFDENEMLKLLAKFCSIEERFVPSTRGYSLYLRPVLIGTNSGIGLAAPTNALFLLIGSPVGAYHPQNLRGISIQTISSSAAVRAWPGGLGNKKIGANYAPCLIHETEARKRGYQHILWLFGDADYMTEAGTMNIFVVFRREDTSGYELATPRLCGTILPGIIRDSVLALARERLQVTKWCINERDISMAEVAAASERGLLVEVFGTGTATIVTPIRSIAWNDREIACYAEENHETYPFASQMRSWIEARQYGEDVHEWSVCLDDILNNKQQIQE